MSSIDEPFIGLDTKLYVLSTLGGAITDGTDEVAQIADVGEVTLSATIIKFNSYGKSYKETRVGQKDPGEQELVLNWVPGDTKHLALKTAFDNKTKVNLSIVWHWGAENARADFEAYVADWGVPTPLEEIVTNKIKLSRTGPVTIDEVTDLALNY